MPAPDYMEQLMTWVQGNIDNEAVLPSRIGKPCRHRHHLWTSIDQRQAFRSPSHSQLWCARSSGASTVCTPTSTATITPSSASSASSLTSTRASSTTCSSSTSTSSPAARVSGARWATWPRACCAVTKLQVLSSFEELVTYCWVQSNGVWLGSSGGFWLESVWACLDGKACCGIMAWMVFGCGELHSVRGHRVS